MIFSYFFQAALGVGLGLSLGLAPLVLLWRRRADAPKVTLWPKSKQEVRAK